MKIFWKMALVSKFKEYSIRFFLEKNAEDGASFNINFSLFLGVEFCKDFY
jgi:hypothetical protein